MRAGNRGYLRIPLKSYLVLLLAACAPLAGAPTPEARYEPSPPPIVAAMLELAAVDASDVVFDLGCGDGRIVIEAAQRHGARGVCVDLDPQRIAEARANAAAAGVLERIAFRQEDLFQTDLRGATVVALFLTYEMNLRLRAKLERELPANTRVVSHWHSMGSWQPLQRITVQGPSREHEVFLFRTRGSFP